MIDSACNIVLSYMQVWKKFIHHIPSMLMNLHIAEEKKKRKKRKENLIYTLLMNLPWAMIAIAPFLHKAYSPSTTSQAFL